MTESADVLDLGSSAEKRAGSSPALGTNAGIAQLEEQRLCKSKVVGSNPATGSKNKHKNGDCYGRDCGLGYIHFWDAEIHGG